MADMKAEWLALCGMNCRLCTAFQRKKKPCGGCRGREEQLPAHCRSCRIRQCTELPPGGSCMDCSVYPCRRLRQMDKRYRERYAVSLMENLERIRASGMPHFLEEEKTRWTCAACGGLLCIHEGSCPSCGAQRHMK